MPNTIGRLETAKPGKAAAGPFRQALKKSRKPEQAGPASFSPRTLPSPGSGWAIFPTSTCFASPPAAANKLPSSPRREQGPPSYDLSEEQLALDVLVAKREGLSLKTVRGDMRDLSVLTDESFDLIINVCSNTFSPEILPVWKECPLDPWFKTNLITRARKREA